LFSHRSEAQRTEAYAFASSLAAAALAAILSILCGASTEAYAFASSLAAAALAAILSILCGASSVFQAC
jgi:arginine repressor